MNLMTEGLSILNSCELKIALKQSPEILSLLHFYSFSLVPERLDLNYPLTYTHKNISHFSLFAYNGVFTVWQNLEIFTRL